MIQKYESRTPHAFRDLPFSEPPPRTTTLEVVLCIIAVSTLLYIVARVSV